MRKIRLSDTDVEFFDLEISPSEYMFYQKHKDAFRTMWIEQDKPFWTRFVITFRSYTVKNGVMKQMSINSPTFENFIDQAFIFIHEQFVDGKVNMAKTFLEDVAKLAQNQDKLPFLDSKSFARDPFYLRETRDLFRRFFGPPDQKSSYVKVYILCPVFLRFGGSVCRCLTRWIDSPTMAPDDDSYWVPPSPSIEKPIQYTPCHGGSHMCANCLDDSGTRFFKEKIWGGPEGPKFVDFWQLGDPRFNDAENPLYNLKAKRTSDWRDDVTVDKFRAFFQYVKFKYGKEMDQCKECSDLRHKMFHVVNQDSTHKKKKKKKKNKKQKEKEVEKLEDLTEEQLSERLMEIVKRNTSLEGAYKEAKELRTKINIIDSPKKTMDTVSSEKADKVEEVQIEQGIFTSKAKVSDDFKCVMSRFEEGSKDNVISGFKIFKMEEQSTGAKETTVKVVTRVQPPEDIDRKSKESEYPLNARMIRNKIEGLPEKLEWWEGVGWCVAVVNYEHEEKGLFKPPTNFNLKVTSSSEDAMKRTMLKLLYYVAKRKKRYSPGWCMDDDDIVACILPDDSPDLAGLAITIQKGFRFQDRLTDEEKRTMTQRPYVGRKVLMTLEPGSAAKMLQTDGGHENLRDLIDRVMEESGYQDDEGDKVLPLHPGTTLYIPGKGGTPILDVEGTRPKDMHAESMWDKLLANPEKFELFLMVDEDKVPEFKKHGLRIVNAETIWQSVYKTGERSCAYCNKPLESCKCFGDKSRLDKSRNGKEEVNQKTENMEKEQKPFESVKKEITLPETSIAEITSNSLNVSEESNLKRTGPVINVESLQDSSILSQASTAKGKELELASQELLYEIEEKVENFVREQHRVKSVDEQAVIEEMLRKGWQTIGKSAKGEKWSSSSNIDVIAEEVLQILQSASVIPLPRGILAKTGMDMSHSYLDSGYQSTTSNENSLGLEDTILKVDDIVTSQSTDKDAKVNMGLDLNDKKMTHGKTGQSLPVSTTNSLILSETGTTSATLKDNNSQNNNNSSVLEVQPGGTIVDKVPLASEGTSVVKASAKVPKTSDLPKTPSTETKRNPDQKLMLPKGFKVHLNVVGDPGYKSKLEEMLEPYFFEKSTTGRQVLPNGTVITQVVYQSACESDEEDQSKSERIESDVQSQKTSNKKMESSLPSTVLKDDTTVTGQKNNVKQKENEEASGKEIGQNEFGETGNGVELSSFISALKAFRIVPNGKILDVTEESENKQNRNNQAANGIEKQEICISKDKETSLTEITENGLRTCYNCNKQEPKRKMFKKCQKCKEEKVWFARYYCKRECQIEDWNKRHKREHKEKLLEIGATAQ